MDDSNKLTSGECHCEPFAFCHSERSPAPHGVQGEAKNLTILLRVNSVEQFQQIATLAARSADAAEWIKTE